MGIWLTVEPIPGSDIADVWPQAVRLARLLEVSVWFQFNDVKVLARPADDPARVTDLVQEYRAQIASDNKHRVAALPEEHR